MDSAGGFNTRNIMIYGESKITGGGLKLYDDILSYERVALKEYMDALGEEIKTYEKKSARNTRPAPASNNRFNNFQQREYNFDEYEKHLLNQ